VRVSVLIGQVALAQPLKPGFKFGVSCSGLIDSGFVGSTDLSGRGTTRAEDAQGTPTQSHISPSIQEYEDYRQKYRVLWQG